MPGTHLNVVDVVTIPSSPEEFIPKSEYKDVLDHLFSKVVVNTENLVLPPIWFQSFL
jgi:hypothetical protein